MEIGRTTARVAVFEDQGTLKTVFSYFLPLGYLRYDKLLFKHGVFHIPRGHRNSQYLPSDAGLESREARTISVERPSVSFTK